MEFNFDLVDSSSAEMLGEAVLGAENFLTAFANNEAFSTSVTLAFRNLINVEAVENFRQQWTSGNFQGLPRIEIRSASEINGANGAFASANNTIYLSIEYVSQNVNNPRAVTSVLLEEIGHYIDSRVNTTDAEGDEGAIFSVLVQDQAVSSQQLQTLKTEDDSAVVNLGEQGVAIEQSLSLVDQPGDVLAPTATINVTYSGFTAAAQRAFSYAVGIWESLIKSPVTIEVQANWKALGQNVLGSAGPVEFRQNFSNAPVTDTWYPSALANSLAGRDLNTAQADIICNFNSGFNWYLSIDGNTPPNQYDFVSTVMHELAHGLGFIGSFKFDPSNNQGTWGKFDTLYNTSTPIVKRLPYIYDRFVENGSGQDLIDQSLFAPNSTALGSQLTSNNIFFNGTKANAANGGRPVLYAPNTWEEGSSIAHLDDGTYDGTLNAMMTHAGVLGPDEHQLGPTTFGMFQDMGWKMNTEAWMYGAPGNDRLDGESTAPLREQRIYGLEGQDTLFGGGGNDFIDGGSGNDDLSGGGDVDVLFGGVGQDKLTGLDNDSLYGGEDNDTYLVGATTVITENPNEGVDTVTTWDNYTLSNNLENLTLLTLPTTSINSVNGTGNALNNTIIGNDHRNTLYGQGGNDTLYGGYGNDNLQGDDGNNYLYGEFGDDFFIGGNQIDYIDGGQDNDRLYALGGDDILFGNSGLDSLHGGEGNDALDGGTGNDYLFGGSETVTLSNTGNDTLNGGAGDDVMNGQDGNDSYTVNSILDKIIEESSTGGTDTVYSTVNWSLVGTNLENLTLTGTTAVFGNGNALDNTIIGNAANNSLDGGGGNDLLDGGSGNDEMNGRGGNDTYVVDNISDIVIEESDIEGIDDVVWASSSYTLSANIERLTLFSGAITGTGNNLENLIYAYEDNNTLNGLEGNDTLYGGAGGDMLYGGSDDDILYGGDSYPTTNTGNDTLGGGTGRDIMSGQDGNDLYLVENPADFVIEEVNEGIDAVTSAITYKLGANVEQLNLFGNTTISGTGNTLSNTLTGNGASNSLNGDAGNDTLLGGGGIDTLIGGTGNDSLTGGAGADRLTGGTGKDRFVFTAKNEGKDTLTDFSVVDDTINISKLGFGGGLTANAAITAAQFRLGSTAGDSSDRFIYNKTSGALLFDTDGTGASASMQFAQLSTGLAMTNNDIFVIA